MSNENITSIKRGYEKALVIFIDILGSQSRNDFEQLLEINELFHTELLGNIAQDREYVAYQRHIYTFSDCAYIIYDYKDKSNQNLGALFDVALLNCEPLLMKFLSKQLVFRGGIAYGDVYYDNNKNMFFGDAVNRAYRYESVVAKYPRIVVDEYVAETVISYTKNLTEKNKQNNLNPEFLSFQKHKGCMVRLDSDGMYYLNYFNSLQQGRDYSLIIGKSNEQFVSDIISMCDTQMSVYIDNNNVWTKYEWLKKYTEQSMNFCIGEPVVYKKTFWDKIFGRIEKDDMLMLRSHMIMPNVGTHYNDEQQYKTFEKYTSSEVLEALWQLGKIDETDK